MSLTFEFCDLRAREAAKAAEKASLDNIKQQALRAETTWREMANRLLSIRQEREVIERARAENRVFT